MENALPHVKNTKPGEESLGVLQRHRNTVDGEGYHSGPLAFEADRVIWTAGDCIPPCLIQVDIGSCEAKLNEAGLRGVDETKDSGKLMTMHMVKGEDGDAFGDGEQDWIGSDDWRVVSEGDV